jgi:hypothetical protein
MLTDKVAVIYEAGGAIGGAVARAFAPEGPSSFSPGASGPRSKRSPRTSSPPTDLPRRGLLPLEAQTTGRLHRSRAHPARQSPQEAGRSADPPQLR